MEDLLTTEISDEILTLKLKRKREVCILSSCVPEYIFEIRKVKTNEKIGFIKLRPILTPELEEYGGHIEYEVNEKFRGNNYAARGCTLLFPLLKKLKINPIIITCDLSNISSVKTCKKIGGKLISTKKIEISLDRKRLTNKYYITL